MHLGHPRLVFAAGSVAAGLLLAAPAVAAPGPSLDLVLDPNASVVTDLGATGKSPGDRYAINAPVRDGSGALVGAFRAAQTSIRTGPDGEIVQTEGVFDLADGTIVFAGIAGSPAQGTGLTTNRSFPRAVIGGSGRYAGAGGTLVSRKRADGAYEQQLRLVLPDGPATTITVPALEGAAEQVVDLPPAGLGPGDLIALSGDIAGGSFSGTQSVLAPVGDDGVSVLSSLTYALPAGALSVIGLGTLQPDGADLVAGRPFVRAVVGGTRGFVGRSGTQSVTRQADGTYVNTLQLWAPSGPVQHTRLRTRTATTTALDLGTPGPGAGDVRVFEDVVLDREGRRVGTLQGSRTTIAVTGTTTVVDELMTLTVGGGTILIGGAPQAGRTVVRPVLGGTGAYTGARGSVRSAPGTLDLRLQRVR